MFHTEFTEATEIGKTKIRIMNPGPFSARLFLYSVLSVNSV